VRDAELPDALVVEGASLLGWPPPRPASGGPAARHPHARPLDRASEPRIQDARGEELVRAFEHVSSLLFPPGDPGILVWQLALESFRADDIHALNAQAPRELAPFVNGLYEQAARDEGGVLASRATYQAGVRTAQGLGALTCGVGTLPYNLSVIRDLQPLAMRCVADVLTDAGFGGSFFYGSDATFDGMAPFLRAHGVVEQITQREMPGLPTGAWGAVSDWALVDQATQRVATSFESNAAPRFVMLLSLSNHSPYTAPSDLVPAIGERVDHALATTLNHAVSDDHARLVTFAYSDAAVGRFLARLDALHLAERSIVVLSADHSTGESYVWGPDTHGLPETDDAMARIPFAVVLPPALLDRAPDRMALGMALRSARRALDAAPLSQNDIPALMLALLGSHGAVKALPGEARWHTLGGQVTSPWFHPPGRDGAYVLGVNGISELFMLDRTGARVGPYEESVFLKTRGDRYSVTPTLIPVTATLSSVMKSGSRPAE
jgi:hypothetical protein